MSIPISTNSKITYIRAQVSSDDSYELDQTIRSGNFPDTTMLVEALKRVLHLHLSIHGGV